ncbi:PREDICTED: uncharacterized protein LOC108359741 [Rhagoletis zephyria]|uniref:uncharacterized protein LOC108359741 n=1 Tax=Rhagoletis zephyria TaxID=28612 RepID=UPI000811352B|nr:PREDICTED: uncharacterized protein LOC108359741 [Rhagoletis zephyria]
MDLCAMLNQLRKGFECDSQSSTNKASPMELKLEPLCIPSFDGCPHKWLAFKDLFETLVHNRDLPVAYKLGKLRQAVKAESVPLVGGLYSGGYEEVWKALKDRYDNPKQLAEIHVARVLNMKSMAEDTSKELLGVVDVVNESLRALTVMKLPAGYEEVWKALKDRYDNPKQLAEIHVARVLNMKSMAEDTSKELLGIVDVVNESLRALTVMKLPADKWDALIVPIVVSKLSARTQREWCMHFSSTELSTLIALLAFLEKRAHSLSTEFCQVADRPDVPHSSSKQKKTPRSLKCNLAATGDGKCQHCQGPHKVMRCPAILAMGPDQRFEALKRSNLCFNCLRSGHPSKLCSSGNCRQCGHRHHTIFCRNKSQQLSTSDGVDTPMAKPDSIANPVPPSL